VVSLVHLVMKEHFYTRDPIHQPTSRKASPHYCKCFSRRCTKFRRTRNFLQGGKLGTRQIILQMLYHSYVPWSMPDWNGWFYMI
jgi:hypothetical protein